MLHAIIVMLKGAAGIVGRINVDALDLAGKILLQRLEGKKIVAVDEHIVKNIGV